jgi:SEC-C motif
MQHGRDQYHHRGEIHPAAEKSQRRRRVALPAPVHGAAETGPPAIRLPVEAGRQTSGLALIPGGMECPSAGTSLAPRGIGHIIVKIKQKLMEPDVCQQDLVHIPLLSRHGSNAMTKTGRNDPCPCGSGKKYKHCCLKKDEAAEHEARAAISQANQERSASRPRLADVMTRIADRLADQYGDYDDDELTNASNTAVDLVRAGKLDQAEQAARNLLVRFPYVHDGYDRLGMVYEARGDTKQAADYYRKAIDFIREHPDQYDGPELEAAFHRLVDKLDPPAPVS